ncbi:MAG: YbhB/YbcL family Raf kinase inhibitor-like protein [Candidatus Binataceae bacterium]
MSASIGDTTAKLTNVERSNGEKRMFVHLINKQMKALACCVLLLGLAQTAYAQTALKLSSSAFAPEGAIPKQFTCDGKNYSPALTWTDVPPNAKTLALIVEDPDSPGGTFVHWVVYNLPATARHLDPNVAEAFAISDGGEQGRNSFGREGYAGPCPPSGAVHHYHFRLYALDTSLKLQPGASAVEVEAAMKGHVLASADFVGTYTR